MAQVSRDLIHEHDIILRGLDTLGEMAERLRNGEDIPPEDLREMVGFLRQFADRNHCGKEDRLYFPALEAAGLIRDKGPLGELMIEHSRARRLLEEMDDALRRETAAVDFAEAAADYADLLRSHFRKENEAIFPLGDLLLPGARQRELLRAFVKHEADVLGTGTHARLRAIAEDLRIRYGEAVSDADRLTPV